MPSAIRTTDDLGAAFRARRRELGLTQQQVADAAGVHRRVIGQLERGKASVQVRIALDLATALGLGVHLHERAR